MQLTLNSNIVVPSARRLIKTDCCKNQTQNFFFLFFHISIYWS